jgi:hypothetical protein
MQWRAATPELELMHGTFGLCRELPAIFSGVVGADSLRKATMEQLLWACRDAGNQTADNELGVDMQLYSHLCQIIEVLAVDNAKDEQLVGSQLSCKLAVGPDALPPMLPNLQWVARDKAHAGRRTFVYQYSLFVSGTSRW